MNTLPPIPFSLVPCTPLPDVVEDSSEAAWKLWDAAVIQLDLTPIFGNLAKVLNE